MDPHGWARLLAIAGYLLGTLLVLWAVTTGRLVTVLWSLLLLAAALTTWLVARDSWWAGELLALIVILAVFGLVVAITRR